MDPNTPLAALQAAPPTSDRISALAAQSLASESGAAFQSLLAVTHDALGRLIPLARDAERSALCLAQQEHARDVAQNLCATRDALHTGIADEARCLREGAPSLTAALRGLLRPTRQRLADAAQAVRDAARLSVPSPSSGASGWFVTTAHAVEALGETATHLDALAHAQPEGSASRELAGAVVGVLERSRDTLFADIARLVD